MYEVMKTQTNPALWTVGFTRPDLGTWEPQSDHDDPDDATDYADELNGDTDLVYLYLPSEPGLWTVGYFAGEDWVPERDYDIEADAVNAVIEINA